MSKSLLFPLLAVLGSLITSQSGQPGFEVDGKLSNGNALVGRIAAKQIDFNLIDTDGNVTPVKIDRNPAWIATDVVLEVNWSEATKLFVLKTPGWTAEARQLTGAVAVSDRDGQQHALELSGCAHLVIRQVRQ
jgi:hypothetical protein